MIIEFPPYQPQIKKEQGKEFIFDSNRRQWVRLTPEEWVRQNFMNYLILEKKYPSSLIAIEKEIKVGEMRKRFDIVVYKDSKPWLIVECKEMNTALNEKVVQQIITYNISLQVPYLIITNGKETLGLIVNDEGFASIQSLPIH
jgi:hypothetical protein